MYVQTRTSISSCATTAVEGMLSGLDVEIQPGKALGMFELGQAVTTVIYSTST